MMKKFLVAYRAELVVIGGYVLLTLLYTYPLVLHLNDVIVGVAGDAESHLWSYWWMRKALLELHTNPYFTQMLYYPEGVSLYFYAYNVVHAIVSIPLQSLFGLIAAYNMTELLGFFVAAYATYWLARDYTNNRVACFFAGVAYGFAPTQLFHFNLGQPNLHGVEFIPLYVLCFRRWLQHNAPYRWLLGAAITLALSSFSDWQFGIYLQLFSAMTMLAVLFAHLIEHGMVQWRTVVWRVGWRTAAVEALYTIAVAPVVIPMLIELSSPRPYMVRSRRDTIYHSADLLAFFVPNPEHPLWKPWAWNLFESLKTPGILLTVVSLSYVALFLALIALARRWQHARFWFWVGLIFFIFALGPQLRFMGDITTIPLPYEILFQSRIIRISRAPARYVVITLLCLAILAAIGLDALQRWFAAHRTKSQTAPSPWQWVTQHSISLVFVSALCFELLPIPVNIEVPAYSPPFMTDGTLDNTVGIIEMPDSSNRGMYYATVHGHPILYGEMSRDNPPGPLLNYLRNSLFRQDIVPVAENWTCIARTYQIHYLMIYPQKGATMQQTYQAIVNRGVALHEVQATDVATLYRLPMDTAQDATDTTCFFIGKGWQKPRRLDGETTDDGTPVYYRWMEQTGTIGLIRQQAGTVTLQFHAHSFAIPRHVEVRANGNIIQTIPIGTPDVFTITLDAQPGLTWIELHTVEPATSPADYGYEEVEPVTIGVSRLHTLPAETTTP